MKITDKKKNKLREILNYLSTDTEKAIYKDSLDSMTKNIDKIKESSVSKEIEKEIIDLKKSISKIRNTDLTPMLDLLSQMNTQLAKPMPDRMADFAPTLKQLVQGISAVKDSVDKKPLPVWNWPQYLQTGVRNKSFEGINPATEETALLILDALGGITPAKTISNAQATVATAGTQIRLSAQSAQSITIKAKIANTGIIYVGNAGVSSSNGFELSAGDTVSLDINDASDVWINSTVNGEGISYITIN